MFENLRQKIGLALLTQEKTSLSTRLVNVHATVQPGMPVYSEMTTRKAVREGYKISVYVYRAVRTIVQAASGIPWVALDINGEPIPDHPFTETWAKPNPEFSGQDNMEYLIAHLKLVGNALIQPLIANGTPKEFWICMPDLIRPIPGDNGTWLKGWEITLTGGGIKTVPPEQFIHFQQFDPGNPYWGVGDLQAAARTVDTDNEAQDTQKLQLQNRNIPPSVFQFKEPLNDDQFREAQRQVREKFLQKSRRGEPWVLGGGYTWQSMALSPVEMDYIASRLQNLRAIAGAFGLDPWWLGDREHSTYNNVSEARRALYEDVVIPLLDDIRSTLNLRVASLYPDKPYISYDLKGVSALRDDFGKKVEQAQKLWQMGIPFEQINSKLELGFEQFEGWETGYLPFSVAPVGEASQPEPEPEIPPQKTVSNKFIGINTEENKVAHWKRLEQRRTAWENALAKKLRPLYSRELDKVFKVLDSEKSVKFSIDTLTQQIKGAMETLKDNWLAILTAAASAVIEDSGKMVAKDLNSKYDPFTQAMQDWVRNHAAENVTTILKTNLEDVRAIILKGVENNASMVDIARDLKVYYDKSESWKAYRVARTEVGSASGYGQRQAAEQSGVANFKIWISSRDDRVRDAHIKLDGETQAFNVPYSNGLMYPGDPSGPVEEIINCRCVESYSKE